MDIVKIKIDKTSIKKINEDAREKYNYLFFPEKCNFVDELMNFLPIFYIDNCCNKLFMNELLVNPVLIETIDILLDANNEIEVGIFLKHLLRKNVKENEFNFNDEIVKIEEIYNLNVAATKNLRKKIYDAVEKHYSQNSIIRKIQFKFNSEKVIKTAMYKMLDEIVVKIKNTNELVFKMFFSIFI